MKTIVLIITLLLCLTTFLFCDKTIYVDVNNSQTGDGSYSNPYQLLQDALDELDSSLISGEVEIYVADGIYVENLELIDISDYINTILIEGNVQNPSYCTIDGDGQGNVILLGDVNDFGSNKEISLQGFTITNSGSYSNNYGIEVRINTILKNNQIHNCMGAINAEYTGCWNYGLLHVIDNNIYNNSTSAAIHARKLNSLVIIGNTINNNNGVASSVGDCEVVEITDNLIQQNNSGILVYEDWYQDYSRTVFLNNNTLISNSNFGIKNTFLAPNSVSYTDLFIKYNSIKNHTSGIAIDFLRDVEISRNVLSSNTYAINCINELMLQGYEISLVNNTIVDNDYGIYSDNVDCEFKKFWNNILWNNSICDIIYDIHLVPTSIATVEYCCIEDMNLLPNYVTVGLGNLNQDPDFIDNISYELSYTSDTNCSPCINYGCPDFDEDGIDYSEDNDDRDPDHSRMDMGYKTYDLPYESRYLTNGWNWRSFPNLDLVTNEDYQNLVGTSGFLGYNFNPTIDDFLEMRYSDVLDDYTVKYELGVFTGHTSLGNKIYQYNGYKIERASNANDFVLKIYSPDYDNSHEYSFTASQPYWVGYPLNETLRIDDYFDQSSTVDFSDVFKIESEDWVYYDDSSGRIIPPPDIRPWGSKPDGKFFEYGQTYIITFNNSIPGFRWDNGIVSGGSSKNVAKTQPTNFTYEEKANYEVFEILSIDDSLNATEVGVFEDGVCVGATVVETIPTQVLAYVSADSSSPGEITFQTSTGLRGFSPEVQEFSVYNQLSDKYETNKNINHLREVNFVKIGKGKSEEIPKKINSIYNYPNPFNPSTIISFYSKQEQQVEVSIFNIKGQKIRTLFDDICQKGENSIQWEGFDSNEKKVSSGIYFYKVESGNQKIMKKMILLK